MLSGFYSIIDQESLSHEFFMPGSLYDLTEGNYYNIVAFLYTQAFSHYQLMEYLKKKKKRS